jgi:hypothetical protein
MQGLNPNFVTELLKICLRNRRVFESTIPHMKPSFLPNEETEAVWSTMVKYYQATDKLITIGLLSQEYSKEMKALNLIADIKEANLPDSEDVLEQLGEFVKSSMFYEAYDKLSDLYNQGKKDKAYELLRNTSESIAEFSIKEQYFTKLYGNIMDRHTSRAAKNEMGVDESDKIPTGIDQFDDITRGGVNRGDIFCALAQSGVGKSKLLRHVGLHASRRGFKGLHVSAEGTLDENLDMYDAGMSGQRLWDIEKAKLGQDTLDKIRKAARDISNKGGEVFIEAFEQFDTASLADVRNLIIEIEKIHGKIDFLCLDYLELFDPGDGKRYGTSNDQERKRRESVANKLKNIAVEFKIAIFTATQASTVNPEMLNDPEFVQTRYNISEFKGVVKPFSYFLTLNQTKDEKEKNMMRIYVDKCRKYAGGQTISIYQRYDRERFYDRKRTINELYTR